MTRDLVAVDPGKHGHGVAHYTHGFLTLAAYRKADVPGPFMDGLRAVCEVPQVYMRGKGDPNDLIDIAIQAGRYTARMQTHYVRPATWKGQTPKSIHHKRIRAALMAGELVALDAGIATVNGGLAHNIIDAVGLGLWYLGRLK